MTEPVTTVAPTAWQTRLLERDPRLHIYLCGIGGVGLSPIATVLLQLGMRVSGSDRQASANTTRVAAAGARVFTTQTADNLLEMAQADRPDVVLISSAIAPDNPERQAAEALGLPVVKRNDFLPAMLAGRRLIAVAGTHGKTTTTSMIVHILKQTGRAPGYIVGADLPLYGSAAAGDESYFVIEADEYDHMFLGLSPSLAVVTNVEWDHPDCFRTPASFRRAFIQFVDRVDRNGVVVSCRDDDGAEQLRQYAYTRGPEWITYGLNAEADLHGVDPVSTSSGGYGAQVTQWGMPAGELVLQVPGLHNVRNALAAVAAASWCDVPIADCLTALASFQGAARRFEQKGEVGGVMVFDDYAHHPTEVRATLSAARGRFPAARIWAVFQPHTYSRTHNLLTEMAASFGDADEVIITDIYAAREKDDGRVSAGALVAAADHLAIRHISGLDTAANFLVAHVQAGDVVLTLGAGDGYRIGEMLLAQLEMTQETGAT